MHEHQSSSPIPHCSILALLGQGTPLVAMLLTAACEPPVEDDHTDPAAPQDPPSPFRRASIPDTTSISLGDGTSCIVTYDGSVECWGRNDGGQLGQGDLSRLGDDETPQ